jgi:hypothetical protein
MAGAAAIGVVMMLQKPLKTFVLQLQFRLRTAI